MHDTWLQNRSFRPLVLASILQPLGMQSAGQTKDLEQATVPRPPVTIDQTPLLANDANAAEVSREQQRASSVERVVAVGISAAVLRAS